MRCRRRRASKNAFPRGSVGTRSYNMHPIENSLQLTRRHFFGRTATGLGVAALASLLGEQKARANDAEVLGGLPGLPHFAPKAKRVIYLFQSGAPSQMDLFDYKPHLAEQRAKELPDSIR